MIGRDQVWSEDIIDAFPRIVGGGVTLPFDKVLEYFLPPYVSVAEYCFHLEVFLSFDNVTLLRALEARRWRRGFDY